MYAIMRRAITSAKIPNTMAHPVDEARLDLEVAKNMIAVAISKRMANIKATQTIILGKY